MSPESDGHVRPRRLATQGVLVPDRQVDVKHFSFWIEFLHLHFYITIFRLRGVFLTELTFRSRWVASGGDNKVCSCCETSCDQRRRQKRLAAGAAGTVYRGGVLNT